MIPTPTAHCPRCGEPTAWKDCTGVRATERNHACRSKSVNNSWLRIVDKEAYVYISGALWNRYREAVHSTKPPNEYFELLLVRTSMPGLGGWILPSYSIPEGLHRIVLDAVRRADCREFKSPEPPFMDAGFECVVCGKTQMVHQ